MSPDHMSAEETEASRIVECTAADLRAEEASRAVSDSRVGFVTRTGKVGGAHGADAAQANAARPADSCPADNSPADSRPADSRPADSRPAYNSPADNRPAGRGFSVLGDSISTLMGWVPEGWRVHYEGEVHVDGVEQPQDTWWGRVIDHFGGHLVANSSFSGSVVEGFGFPAGNSEERIAALLGTQGERPDVVLVYMGINDYGWGGGRNQVMGGSLSSSARPEDLPGEPVVDWIAGPEVLDRFAAAYRDVLSAIRRRMPASKIWCVTLCPATSPSEAERCYKYQIRGIELDAYNRAIAHVAREMGAHVADVRAYGVQYDAVDGCHPSALGMRQIADMVIARMEGSSEMPATIEEAPRAVRTCGRTHCHGCPMDESTDSRWTIACRGPKTER